MLCEDTYILPDNTASTVNSVQVAKNFFLSLVALRVGWRSFLYLEVLGVFFSTTSKLYTTGTHSADNQYLHG